MKIVGIVTVISAVTGCASGLNSAQKREYQAFKSNNVLIEEKKPGAGAALGILPGGGSFYAREPGLGIVNLLFWPLSVLWDPVSGHNGSKVINYDLTKYEIRKNKEADIGLLDERLGLGEIDNKEYILEKRKVEKKYTYD